MFNALHQKECLINIEDLPSKIFSGINNLLLCGKWTGGRRKKLRFDPKRQGCRQDFEKQDKSIPMTPNKREQQRDDRRIEILNCSLNMLVSRGFAAMRIRDIADQLGISIGLFFNYFESKEKVYE